MTREREFEWMSESTYNICQNSKVKFQKIDIGSTRKILLIYSKDCVVLQNFREFQKFVTLILVKSNPIFTNKETEIQKF